MFPGCQASRGSADVGLVDTMREETELRIGGTMLESTEQSTGEKRAVQRENSGDLWEV